jgi:N-acetyl-alpha-D-muramate 1-phosphate uridylyltransferase
MVMKAMILAAGLGTRLGRITEKIPKALVEINGKTALHLAVENATKHGFDDIIINVHHYADLVENEVARLNKSGFRISVSDERDGLLETGGGLYKARDFFDKNPFLLLNVDIVTDFNLSDLLKFHLQKKGIAALSVRHRTGNRFFLINDEGIIKGWRNRATGEQILACDSAEGLREIAFSGIHIIDPEIFNYMHEGKYTMTDIYLKLASDHNIFTLRDDNGYWGDIGSPESLEYIRKMLDKNS